MRTLLGTLFHSVGTIALLITVIVGVLAIVEKTRAMCVDFYRDFVAFRLSRAGKKVLAVMKQAHPRKPYTVAEIAVALKLTNRRTWAALEKLETEGRVYRMSVDQAIGGALWTLEELEL